MADKDAMFVDCVEVILLGSNGGVTIIRAGGAIDRIKGR
jgi:hypothetical protein